MIPMNDVVTVHKAGKTDKWGIPEPSTGPIELEGMVTYNTVLEELKTVEGTTITVIGTAVFKGKVDIKTGDEISVGSDTGDDKFNVLSVVPVKDLSGKQILTKVLF